MKPNQEYLKVAVDAPLPESLTYATIEGAPTGGWIGQPVIVPLGKRTVKAVVMGTTSEKGDFKVRPIKQIDETRPELNSTFLKWLSWLSEYYLHPIGQVTSLAFPPLKKGGRATKRSPVVPELDQTSSPVLMPEQQKVFADISKNPGFGVHLLHGITGSGKTEIYLNLLGKVLETGKQGLVLVPEISLTPQLIDRFAGRFPGEVAVIHSHLTEREKTNQWWQVVDNEKKILVGARSALFCPTPNLGMIVIDEEHEPSFKQDEKLKYHARDAAIMLAKLYDIPIILGSATPSLETWQRTCEGKYQLHTMKSRVADRKLPEVEVIDMREERQGRKENEPALSNSLPFWLSEALYEKMKAALESEHQSALFLNRRGMAQTVLCQSCGHLYECPNCAISLTLHANHYLVCHYCDYSEPHKEHCSQCHSEEVQALGLGTELIETDLKLLFPEANIARADRDEIQNREDLEKIIKDMEQRRIDILVGTQMIAKGLDFPYLNLVGLVMADVGFNLPDFRSAERSFQLITQVSGRSGRHLEEVGQVVIQTYNPEHISIQYSKNADYVGFADHELAMRKELSYPPFGRLASIRVQGSDESRVRQTAQTLAQRGNLLKSRHQAYESVRVLGPTPSPLAKLRGKHRHLLLLKCPDISTLKPFLKQLLADLSWASSGTKVQIDVDPINML